MCSLLIFPCLPPLLRDLSVPGYLWHLWKCMCVCVWGCGVVWEGCRRTCSLPSHHCGCLSVALWWNRWPPAALGVSCLQFLPLWTRCCQIKPSTAHSDASSIKCVVTNTFTCLPISLSISSRLLALLSSIFQSCCLFLWLPSYLLSWLSPYYLQKNLGLNFCMSHAAILRCSQHPYYHSKAKHVVTDFRNINILWGGVLSAIN